MASVFQFLSKGFRVGSRLTFFFVLLCCLIPFQLSLSWLPPTHPLRLKLIMKAYLLLLISLGIRLKITGECNSYRPCLYVSNHSSYIDILVLGALLQASFISKHEVRSWPVVGFFAKSQGTLFINRSRSTLHTQHSQIGQRLSQEGSLILFPEGTTNDGSHIFPFKSALFAKLNKETSHKKIHIQSISIGYVKAKGISLGRKFRREISWTGSESLLPHLIRLLSHTPLTVHVHFAPSFMLAEESDRKMMTRALETQVSEGLSQIFQGAL